MKNSARFLAFQTLERIYGDKAYTNIALQHSLSRSNLNTKDKGLCTEIVYGTVRRQITIDALLTPFLSRPLADLDGEVVTLLRMSVYQFAFLERVPDYAVIDEAVEIAKRVIRRASGMVNGVLRNYLRAKQTLDERIANYLSKQKKSGDTVFEMSIRHGYPVWMVQRLSEVYGLERTASILIAGNRPAPLTLRVNPLKATVDAVQQTLIEAGAGSVDNGQLAPEALVVHGGLDVEKLELYGDGKITIQDEGAMLVAPLLRPEPGQHVVDMCAAPGGKTTHIAELMKDQGDIEAFDVYLQKVRQIRKASQRLGLDSIEAKLGDGRTFVAESDQMYDAVLVDAPCTGLGVMRRRPDVRHHRTEDDVRELAKLQRDLLESACRAVKSGGVVVYATCTLLPEENELVVSDVINRLDGQVVLDDIRDSLPERVRPYVHDGLVLTPELFDTDGFYMARLRKV